ncbi:MAG TPA: hypothetical protein PLW93_02725 [Candidatus Absconditabacterales bacterium]|nr:hypothetical protein [Candidatus Absconditabacterales bacterium]HNG97164.1 hypothetical protein [Candidatus Absconditabacterales bacterium]
MGPVGGNNKGNNTPGGDPLLFKTIFSGLLEYIKNKPDEHKQYADIFDLMKQYILGYINYDIILQHEKYTNCMKTYESIFAGLVNALNNPQPYKEKVISDTDRIQELTTLLKQHIDYISRYYVDLFELETEGGKYINEIDNNIYTTLGGVENHSRIIQGSEDILKYRKLLITILIKIEAEGSFTHKEIIDIYTHPLKEEIDNEIEEIKQYESKCLMVKQPIHSIDYNTKLQQSKIAIIRQVLRKRQINHPNNKMYDQLYKTIEDYYTKRQQVTNNTDHQSNKQLIQLRDKIFKHPEYTIFRSDGDHKDIITAKFKESGIKLKQKEKQETIFHNNCKQLETIFNDLNNQEIIFAILHMKQELDEVPLSFEQITKLIKTFNVHNTAIEYQNFITVLKQEISEYGIGEKDFIDDHAQIFSLSFSLHGKDRSLNIGIYNTQKGIYGGYYSMPFTSNKKHIIRLMIDYCEINGEDLSSSLMIEYKPTPSEPNLGENKSDIQGALSRLSGFDSILAYIENIMNTGEPKQFGFIPILLQDTVSTNQLSWDQITQQAGLFFGKQAKSLFNEHWSQFLKNNTDNNSNRSDKIRNCGWYLGTNSNIYLVIESLIEDITFNFCILENDYNEKQRIDIVSTFLTDRGAANCTIDSLDRNNITRLSDNNESDTGEQYEDEY